MTTNEGLQIFTDAVAASGMNVEAISALTTKALRYLNQPSSKRHAEPCELEKHWYDSVKNGSPDFGIYDTDYYLAETFACWKVYSSQYIRECKRAGVFDLIARPHSVLDMGCGIGLSTAQLRLHYEHARVVGTNLQDTKQWMVASRIAARFHFILFSEHAVYENFDIVFASEFFEHLQEPTQALTSMLMRQNPELLIIANTFNAPSIGHFERYKSLDGHLVDGKSIGREFSAVLRAHGYERVQNLGFWNDRPQVWRRKQ